ncbi:MAG: hypothetical protein K940chlam8_00932 [Chlamydiae bacterium]|nr:hypothetical protein [Chlamydiota bacterium]
MKPEPTNSRPYDGAVAAAAVGGGAPRRSLFPGMDPGVLAHLMSLSAKDLQAIQDVLREESRAHDASTTGSWVGRAAFPFPDTPSSSSSTTAAFGTVDPRQFTHLMSLSAKDLQAIQDVLREESRGPDASTTDTKSRVGRIAAVMSVSSSPPVTPKQGGDAKSTPLRCGKEEALALLSELPTANGERQQEIFRKLNGV